MGDIKEAPMRPTVQSRVHDGIGVLDRHGPASEGHHLGAISDMEIVQWSFLQRSGIRCELSGETTGDG